MHSILVEACALAEAVLPRYEKLCVLVYHGRADNKVALLEANPPDANSIAALVAHFLFMETDAHPVMGDEHDFILTVGRPAIDEAVAFLDPDGNDAALADVLEIIEVRFLHDAATCREDNVQLLAPGFLIGLLSLDSNGGCDFLLIAELEQVDVDRPLLAREPSGISKTRST